MVDVRFLMLFNRGDSAVDFTLQGAGHAAHSVLVMRAPDRD